MKEPQEISVFKACHNNRFEIAPFSDDLLLTSTSHTVVRMVTSHFTIMGQFQPAVLKRDFGGRGGKKREKEEIK